MVLMLERNINQQVLFLALAPAIAISLILGVYFTKIRLNDLANTFDDRGTAVVSRLSAKGEYGVLTKDTKSLRKMAQVELNNIVSSVSYYDTDGKELASAGKLSSNITPPASSLYVIHKNHNKPNDTYVYTMAITLPEVVIDDFNNNNKSKKELKKTSKSTIIGWAKIELERKSARLQEYQILIHSTLIVLLGLSITGLFALRLGFNVTQPILALTQAVRDIQQGKLETRVIESAKWELGVLESGINAMASSMHMAHKEMQAKIAGATKELKETLNTLEVQNLKLKKARADADNSNKNKSEFLANISHELRTPLNGIIGFINLLKKTEQSSQQKDLIATLNKSAHNLLSILNDILDFSKIEAGMLKLNETEIRIRDCIEDALTLLAPSAQEKGLEIIPFVYKDVPSSIISDPLRIKQVVTNLVSNSIKFTDTGTITVRVMLEQDTNDEITLCISVADTGIGLTTKQQKELFRAFNQLSPNIAHKFGGTGLGLVICKKIVEQMNGSIDLESEPNKGSTFWFTLGAKKSNKKPSNRFSQLKEFKVLLFERNPITRLAIRHMLTKWEINVVEADYPEEIVPKLMEANSHGNPFDICLIGINQAIKLNKPTCDLLRSIQTSHLCPFGVFVNSTCNDVHNEIYSMGAKICIAKPLLREKVYNALLAIKNNACSKQIITNTKTPNILVVDDNAENLKLACAFLKNIGVKMSLASSGNQALEFIHQEEFQMILMDLHMPGLDGVDTAKAIRQSNTQNKHIPIIALTANLVTKLSNDMNDCLIKPVSEQELKACIHKWTNKGIIDEPQFVKEPKESIMEDKSIDFDLGAKLAGGKRELAREMLDMLFKNLSGDLKMLNNAYSKKNYQLLADKAHKLHGACCYVGVPRLKNMIANLENNLLANKTDNLEAEMAEINTEIKNLLKCKDKIYEEQMELG